MKRIVQINIFLHFAVDVFTEKAKPSISECLIAIVIENSPEL